MIRSLLVAAPATKFPHQYPALPLFRFVLQLTSILQLLRRLLKSQLLDLLPLCTLNNPRNIDALQMHILGLNLAHLHNLIRFHQRNLRILPHRLVEIILRFAELAVAHSVRFVHFYEGVVTEDGFFHYVVFAVEFARFFGLGHYGYGAVFVVTDWELAGLYFLK